MSTSIMYCMRTLTTIFSAPSGPPMDVVVSPRTHSSITVRWSAPPQEQWNGPLLGFKVRHKLQGYPDETVTVDDISSPAITEHIIDELITFQVWGNTGKYGDIYSIIIMLS